MCISKKIRSVITQQTKVFLIVKDSSFSDGRLFGDP